MIELNCLISVEELDALDVKTVRLKEKINYGDLFKNHLDVLSKKGQAVCYPYKGKLYFIGDERSVIQNLADFIEDEIVSDSLDLRIREQRNIFSYIFYRAFIKKLIDVGYLPLKGIHKKRKLIPSLKLKDFIVPLDKVNSYYVCYGLKFGIKILKNGKLLLFIDLYSPAARRLGNRFFPVSIKGGRLFKNYKKKSVLPSRQRYQQIKKVIELLKAGKDKIHVTFPDGSTISFLPAFLSPHQWKEYFHVDELDEPSLKFKVCESRNPIQGLKKCKPYSYLEYKDANISLHCIIDDKIEEQKVNKLIKYLKDGCKDDYETFNGFKETFGAQLKIVKIEDASFNTPQDIKEEINKIPTSNPHSPLVIVIFRDEIAPRGTTKGTQFYNELKTFCIKKRIRAQFLRESSLDRLEKKGQSIIIYNLATVMYAKSNGTPWKIKEAAPLGSVIIGMAFSVDHDSKEIKAGTLYLFDRFGKHLFIETKKYRLPLSRGYYIPYDVMKEMLEEIKGRIRDEYVNIIFHKSAPYHKDEIKAISDTLGEDMNYALLTLKSDHLIRVFDTNAENSCVTRGTCIFIKEGFDNSFILCTTGNSCGDNSTIRKRPDVFGTPKPIEIVVEKNQIENFNMKEIARHVLLLTKADWNTCNLEVREPITTKYARKAASLLPLYEGDYTTFPNNDVRDLM